MTLDDLIEISPDVAYRVPLFLDRSTPPWFRLANCGRERLHGIVLTEFCAGRVVSESSPRVLDVGEAFTVMVASKQPDVDTVLMVRWIRPDGREYVWRASF